MRCKFNCSRKQINKDDATLIFSAVVDGSPENKEFFKYTPSGTLQVHTINLAVAERFETGKAYYIDLSPAE